MATLAFPTAEGAGRYAQGGRGGHVYYVTSLDDSGPGTLRDVLSNPGPKNILFQVSGTIRLSTPIYIGGEQDSYLTIAGQSSPGGIQIADRSISFMGGIHDVVIRYIRFRNNVTNNITGGLINKSLLFWDYWVDPFFHDMCYDSFRNQHICYGGWNDTFTTETWSWNGSNWTYLTNIGPEERTWHCMAYNSTNHKTILYGGARSGYYYNTDTTDFIYTDTWEWDGSSWSEITTANSPLKRIWTDMVYDPVRNEVVLFGGKHSSTYYNDTWVYDGTNWTQKTPATSPSARYMHSMAWDAVNNRIVLFGGIDSGGNCLQSTYTWDGNNWTLINPITKPPVRAGHGMYSYSTGVILFGGRNTTASLSDAYTWNGTNWTLIDTIDSPDPRYAHAMSSDGTNIFVFSGNVYEDISGRLHDMWKYNGSNWTELTISDGPSTDYPTIHDIILDHCSLEWGCDGSLGLTGIDKFTIQNCIVSEGSFYGDVVQSQGMNCTRAYRRKDERLGELSLHRNFFAQNYIRVPAIDFNNGILNFINNVIYNYSLGMNIDWSENDYYATSSVKINIIGNVWKRPKETRKGDPGYNSYARFPIYIEEYATTAIYGYNSPPLDNNSIYLYDNYDDDMRPSSSDSEWIVATVRFPGKSNNSTLYTNNVFVSSSPSPQKIRSLTEFDTFETTIYPHSSIESLLGLSGGTPDVGAAWPTLDEVDLRLISEFQNRIGFAGVGKYPQENPNPTPSSYGMSCRGKVGGTSINDQPPLPNTQKVRYSPYEITYTLTNNADHSIDWTVTKDAGFEWLNISSGSGTLTAGSHTHITLTVDTSETSVANSLVEGIYNCEIAFTNVTDALTTKRVIPLEIYSDTTNLKISQVFLNATTATRGTESPALIASASTLYYNLWNESTTTTLNYTISYTNNTSTIITNCLDEFARTSGSLSPLSYVRCEARLSLPAVTSPCYATMTITANGETVKKYIVYNPVQSSGDLVVTNYDTYLVNPNAIVPWPSMSSGIAPTDTDSDGIPDSNEADYGLNPLILDAHNISPNGYSYLELYLNNLVGE